MENDFLFALASSFFENVCQDFGSRGDFYCVLVMSISDPLQMIRLTVTPDNIHIKRSFLVIYIVALYKTRYIF